FFSSRRRHTRFSRDWSSDVCSSDLSEQPGWQVHTSTAALTADQVVVATAYEATALLPQAYLPLKRIRGQLSYLDATQTPALHTRSEEHTSELQSRENLVCRLLLEKK